jgi:release factor glutamine methyltransferase
VKTLGARRRLRHLVEAAAAHLDEAGIESARGDAEWLLAGILDLGRGALGLRLDEEPGATLTSRYQAAVQRRARREPLQRILGWEEFRGLRLALTPAVLVPRPETEMLVELALALLPVPGDERRLLVVDVGTGCGCIACAIAAERPDAQVLATDRSLESLTVARENARRLGLAGRLREVASDVLAAVRDGRVDLIVSNPPYLPSGWLSRLDPEVRDHDPVAALDGGPDGLRVLERLVAESTRTLRSGGALVVETAGDAQAAEVARRAAGVGLVGAQVRRDLAGVGRFVIARRA